MMPLSLENFETLCLRLVKDTVWHFETLGWGGGHTSAALDFAAMLPHNFTVNVPTTFYLFAPHGTTT